MSAADFSLRLATDPDGRLTELCLSSPTGSPQRSPQRPLRPALKPTAAAPPRRVQWAARNQVHRFSSREAEGQEQQDDEKEKNDPRATAAWNSVHSSGNRQHRASQPASPGWHSPPAADMRQQPGAYSVPAVQPNVHQPYWDAAAAAATYYHQYGWAYQPPVPGQQVQSEPQPATAQQGQTMPWQESQQWSQEQPKNYQQQLQQQQPQQQQSPLQASSSSVGQGSIEHGSSAPGSPAHWQVQAGSVHITIDSPEVKLQGMHAPAASHAAAAAAVVTAAGEQHSLPAKTAGCSAGTQTEACSHPDATHEPASGSAQPQLEPVAQPARLPSQPQPSVQQFQVDLPPGYPAGQPPPQPWQQEQRQERQGHGRHLVPPLRLPFSPSPAASCARPKARQHAAAGRPAFDGDVSNWRRLPAGDSYWEGEGLATGGSLSSGLSPREGGARLHEWDHAEALERLAAQATAYGHSVRQQMRGGGPVSATDALPARMAAQQLASLAGMSRKVQEALLHSQAVFQRQASVVEQAVLARAFWAWRHLHARQQQRRAAALAARRRIEMGRLRRCLHAWRRQCVRHDASHATLQRAAAQLRRSVLHRCWREWRRLLALRAWKLQVEVRDQQIQLMGQKLRHLECRPVRYMARWRMRMLLFSWQAEAQYQCAKRHIWQAAAQHRQRLMLAAAFGGWQAVAAEAAARRRVLQRAAQLLGRLKLRRVLVAWQGAVEHRAVWRERVAGAKQLRRRQLAQRALRSWRYIAWFYHTAAAAEQRRRTAILASALGAWRRRHAAKAATKVLLAELQRARGAWLTGQAFGAWAAFVEGQQAKRLDDELRRLGEAVQRLGTENEQLKRENERLARVVDSGDWGLQRVQELQEAGRVLQAERDALQKLVAAAAAGAPCGLFSGSSTGAGMAGAELLPLGDATNSPDAVPALARPPCQAGCAQYEGGTLQQYRVSAAGIQPAAGLPSGRGGAAIPASWGGGAASGRPGGDVSCPTSPAVRNKLLVKSGSSFNAMVRALKQDLVASGALARGTGPAALYEVDKLSLNRLSVAANGEVEVQAVSSPDRQAVAFRSSYPPSPKRQLLGAAAAATPKGQAGSLAAGLQPAGGGKAAVEAGAPLAGSRAAAGRSIGLLEAALRLQGIGGRSVGLRGSRG